MKGDKSTKQIILLILGMVLIGAGSIFAQAWQADLNFIVGKPLDDFEKNATGQAMGLSFAWGYRTGAMPFTLGTDLAFLVFRNQSRQEPLGSAGAGATVDVQAANNLLQGHLFMRFQGQRGAFRPYMDGLLGFNYLLSQFDFSTVDGNNNIITQSTNQYSVALSYGGGGGFLIRVAGVENDPNEMVKLKEVLINLRVRYLFGGNADFLQQGTIRNDAGQIVYDVQRSRTDLLTVELGIGIGF